MIFGDSGSSSGSGTGFWEAANSWRDHFPILLEYIPVSPVRKNEMPSSTSLTVPSPPTAIRILGSLWCSVRSQASLLASPVFSVTNASYGTPRCLSCFSSLRHILSPRPPLAFGFTINYTWQASCLFVPFSIS